MSRPKQPGLTENELDVMNVLWQESPLKIADILKRLGRVPKPAYTSLMTLVQAMDRKGYITHRQEGKAFAYSPKLQKSDFTHHEVQRLARRLFGSSPFALATHLVKSEHLSKEEIQQLRDLLEAQ